MFKENAPKDPKRPVETITLARRSDGAWALYINGVEHPEHYAEVRLSTGTPWAGVLTPTHDYFKVRVSFHLQRPEAEAIRDRAMASSIEQAKDHLSRMGLIGEVVHKDEKGAVVGARLKTDDDDDPEVH